MTVEYGRGQGIVRFLPQVAAVAEVGHLPMHLLLNLFPKKSIALSGRPDFHSNFFSTLFLNSVLRNTGMQPLLLPPNLQGAFVELGGKERLGPGLLPLVRNDALGQRLGQDMGHGTEGRECLFDEDIPGRHDLVVLALVVSEKDLHGQAVPAVSLWIAEDSEVDVLPAEDLEPRVVIAAVHTVTHPAPLHAWLDVLVRAAFYVCVGIRFLVILLHFCR